MEQPPDWASGDPELAQSPPERKPVDPMSDAVPVITGEAISSGTSPFVDKTMNTVRTTARSSPVDEDIAATPPGPGGFIGRIQDGMTVIDATGRELGTVDGVVFGDPEAPGAFGEAIEPVPRPGWFRDHIFGSVKSPVPKVLRTEMLRAGFIHIAGEGLLPKSRFALSDQIAGVDGERVVLLVRADELVEY